MSTNTQKPARLLAAIKEQIQFLLGSGAVIADAFDANDDPYLSIAFSGQTHLVLVKHELAPASGLTDGLGLTQRVYTPDVAFVGIDTAAEGAGLDADTEKAKAVITAVVAPKFTRLSWHYKAAIAVAELVDGDATQVVTFSPAYDGFGYLGNM